MSPIESSFSTSASAGMDDTTYIGILRGDMDDPPVPYTESFVAASTTPFVRLNKYPAYDADDFLSVSSGASGNPPNTAFAQVDSRQDILQNTQFFLDSETGYVFFLSAAQTANLTVAHYTVRWTNRRCLNALYAGMKAMFPRVWQRKNYVFQAVVNQWEYALPNDFLDPRAVVYRVEFQEIPFATERYHRVSSWFVIGTGQQIHIPWSQEVSPGANIRVTYAAPYNSLSELEPQVQHLPLWYAKGKLLMDKEVLRSRYDLGPVQQNEQQYPPGTSQNAGIYHMQQFERELDRLQRPLPTPGMHSVYMR